MKIFESIKVTCFFSPWFQGNEIIQKLQTEMRALKQRLKMMNIVTTKQEKLIEDKELLIKQNEDKISTLSASEEAAQKQVTSFFSAVIVFRGV